MDKLLSNINDQLVSSELKKYPLLSIYALLSSIIYKSNLDIKF